MVRRAVKSDVTERGCGIPGPVPAPSDTIPAAPNHRLSSSRAAALIAPTREHVLVTNANASKYATCDPRRRPISVSRVKAINRRLLR